MTQVQARPGRRAGRLVVAAIAIEVSLLALERLLVHAIGQEPIAAAMLSVPTSRVAVLGAAAVVVRIAGHALFPALAVGAAVACVVAALVRAVPDLDAGRALAARWIASRPRRRPERAS